MLPAHRDELQSRDRAIKAYEADLNDLKVRLEESRERENNLEKINTSLLNEDRHLKSVSAEYRSE